MSTVFRCSLCVTTCNFIPFYCSGEFYPFFYNIGIGVRTPSYLEIAYAITQHGASPNSDLEELWRRIIFTVLISNTDDHLRNHGFLYERHKGWRLSPAYDVNPTPVEIKARMLSTSIDYDDPTVILLRNTGHQFYAANSNSSGVRYPKVE